MNKKCIRAVERLVITFEDSARHMTESEYEDSLKELENKIHDELSSLKNFRKDLEHGRYVELMYGMHNENIFSMRRFF